MSDCCDTSTGRYDLIILGGGAAAFAAANRANQLKKRTLVINDRETLPLGGTCVNVGCIPSKIMLYQGATAYYPPRSPFRGIRASSSTDFTKALQETREMVSAFQEQNYGKVIAQQEYVSFQEGHGEFVDPHTIRVGTETYTGEHIILATGARTFIPNIPGLDTIDYLTNKSR